mmetsp:Transcript_21165/g.43519  ORF Transcript_21165/g.43519 Transcript_21165/m.43519 type:complete len:543 (+) Transcript_21165:1940-3568(+)
MFFRLFSRCRVSSRTSDSPVASDALALSLSSWSGEVRGDSRGLGIPSSPPGSIRSVPLLGGSSSVFDPAPSFARTLVATEPAVEIGEEASGVLRASAFSVRTEFSSALLISSNMAARSISIAPNSSKRSSIMFIDSDGRLSESPAEEPSLTAPRPVVSSPSLSPRRAVPVAFRMGDNNSVLVLPAPITMVFAFVSCRMLESSMRVLSSVTAPVMFASSRSCHSLTSLSCFRSNSSYRVLAPASSLSIRVELSSIWRRCSSTSDFQKSTSSPCRPSISRMRDWNSLAFWVCSSIASFICDLISFWVRSRSRFRVASDRSRRFSSSSFRTHSLCFRCWSVPDSIRFCVAVNSCFRAPISDDSRFDSSRCFSLRSWFTAIWCCSFWRASSASASRDSSSRRCLVSSDLLSSLQDFFSVSYRTRNAWCSTSRFLSRSFQSPSSSFCDSRTVRASSNWSSSWSMSNSDASNSCDNKCSGVVLGTWGLIHSMLLPAPEETVGVWVPPTPFVDDEPLVHVDGLSFGILERPRLGEKSSFCSFSHCSCWL